MARTSTGAHGTWNTKIAGFDGRIVRDQETDHHDNEHRSRASMEKTQREIAGDRTDSIAAHRKDALTRFDP